MGTCVIVDTQQPIQTENNWIIPTNDSTMISDGKSYILDWKKI